MTKLQAQYRIVTEPCGPLLTGMGTVAGRPKAIGYYDQFWDTFTKWSWGLLDRLEILS